jgi:hypothetical protein
MVIVGLGNKVLNKEMTIPMHNYPNFLNFGIIKKDKVFLREFSSSAAPVKIILKKGNIISHWNEQEVWANCYFDGQFGYIKTDDFQGIN